MISIEFEIQDGDFWKYQKFVTATEHKGENYALCVGGFILSYYWTKGEGDNARLAIDEQLHIIGHIARFFGVGPSVYKIRKINTNIEVTNDDENR